MKLTCTMYIDSHETREWGRAHDIDLGPTEPGMYLVHAAITVKGDQLSRAPFSGEATLTLPNGSPMSYHLYSRDGSSQSFQWYQQTEFVSGFRHYATLNLMHGIGNPVVSRFNMAVHRFPDDPTYGHSWASKRKCNCKQQLLFNCGCQCGGV